LGFGIVGFYDAESFATGITLGSGGTGVIFLPYF
jgi:hypothetical protein